MFKRITNLFRKNKCNHTDCQIESMVNIMVDGHSKLVKVAKCNKCGKRILQAL